jgi:hypothetical protein
MMQNTEPEAPVRVIFKEALKNSTQLAAVIDRRGSPWGYPQLPSRGGNQ